MDNILKKGKTAFCLISKDTDIDWIQGLISYISVNKKVVEVFVSSIYLKDKFSPEDKVIVKFLNNKNEFLFSGNIRMVVSSINKKAVIINIEDIKKFNDYRKNERYYVNFDARINFPEGKKNNASLLDISSGGLQLATEGNFNINDQVNVEVLYNPENPITFKGKILRKSPCKSLFKYGLTIEDIDSENITRLNELIELLTLKKAGIEHEWQVFKRIRLAVYSLSVLTVFFFVFIVLASKGI